MKLSTVLLAPMIAFLALLLYLVFGREVENAVYGFIPLGILVAIIIVLAPQIDWWWWKKNPPSLDPKFIQLIERYIPFYGKLSTAQQKEFRDRTMLFQLSRDFMAKAAFEEDGIPEDVKMWISAYSVMLTLGRKEYLHPEYEKIVVYPTLFPSPLHPRTFHPGEIFVEDGVVLLAANAIVNAVKDPSLYYNIAIHEWASASEKTGKSLPIVMESDLETLASISGFSTDYIQKFYAIPSLSWAAVAVHHFFRYPEAFKSQWLSKYEEICNYFHLDPAAEKGSVVLISL
jgi:Mlc titration factor MtfA (ptsG expression regulator)